MISFHSFIRIFGMHPNILSLVGKKYSSELDIFSLVYPYICKQNEQATSLCPFAGIHGF